MTDTAIPSTLPELLSQPMVLVRTGFSASRKGVLKLPRTDAQHPQPAFGQY